LPEFALFDTIHLGRGYCHRGQVRPDPRSTSRLPRHPRPAVARVVACVTEDRASPSQKRGRPGHVSHPWTREQSLKGSPDTLGNDPEPEGLHKRDEARDKPPARIYCNIGDRRAAELDTLLTATKKF
jgi:hypothetical protein